MKSFELMPANGQKSFYNKAVVNQSENGVYTLYSYNTKVAQYDHKNYILTLSSDDSHFSQTTNKHINSFLEFNNLPAMSKKELLKFHNRVL